MHDSRPILLIEDDAMDVMRFKRAIQELHISNPILWVANINDAFTILDTDDQAPPCLIFLDLSTPGGSGIELLESIQQHERLQMIPIVILTVSNRPKDINACFDYGVGGYICKNYKYDRYVQTLEGVFNYWRLNQVPHLCPSIDPPEQAD